MNSSHKHHATAFLEEAEILAHDAFAGDQYQLVVSAPQCALHARPGSFAHVRCDPELPMRRPLSIMRTEPAGGRVEFLYKVVGHGTRKLSERRIGEFVSLLGPIGRSFSAVTGKPRALLIGGGVGIPPLVFLASALHADSQFSPLFFMGSELPFPFIPRPSKFVVSGVPADTIAAMPQMEDLGIQSRLASLQGFAGCYHGYVTDLARVWLDSLDDGRRSEVALYACGPHSMLETVAQLAREFALPCQVSLEEFMACGVGGCAGCVVEVQTVQGSAMKRVCVDGPVFEAGAVFPSG